MKTFLRFSTALISVFLVAIGSSKADIAVEGHPNEHHVANGRYFRDPRPDGSVEYKAFRSDETFTSPQLIKYNLATGRWELLLQRRAGGAPELAASSDVASSVNVLASGWRTSPSTGPVSVSSPLKVYIAIEQYASCSSCSWNNSRTWSSGIIPRAYDNVMIDGNVSIDTPSKCNNLIIKTSYTAIRSLVGRSSESKLKLYGNLRHELGTLMDVVELEFAGNTVQTIEMSFSPGTVLTSRVIINTLKNLVLNSPFRFVQYGSKCVTTFVKGKIHLGDHDLICQDIVDADETRFVVTNGNGMLRFFPRMPGEGMLHRFPVGPSADRYTPILVLFATANREYSDMRAKAKYDSGIFPSYSERVNVLYTVDHGTSLPASGTPLTWVYQFQWEQTDAIWGFNPDYPVQIQKWNGSSWSAPIVRGSVTGTDPYRILFTARSTGVNHFGLITETKRVVGARLSAEEGEANTKLDFTTFPNPATTSGFNVNVGNPETAELRLQSISGLTMPFNAVKNSDNSLAISPIQDLIPGVYLLQVKENEKIRVHKVLVR